MRDEEASVALLGVADAAFLGGGGRLLVRLDGREPVGVYGYQGAPHHRERRVRVMRSASPAPHEGPREPPAATTVSPTPPPSESLEADHAEANAPEQVVIPAPEVVEPDHGVASPRQPGPPIEVICFG